MVIRRNVSRIVKEVRKRKKMTNHLLRIVYVKEWGYTKNWIKILTSHWVIDLGD